MGTGRLREHQPSTIVIIQRRRLPSGRRLRRWSPERSRPHRI